MPDRPLHAAPPTVAFPADAAATRDDGTQPPLATPPGYELFEQVGAGGMGVVYRAREIAFDRDVAVKILQERFHANSPASRRFLDEARITGQLQHPAIPPVHHMGTLPDGRPFLAMKLIRGETLADLLARTPAAGAPGSPNFIPVFAQVCQAVAYAHCRKVIHRDLKPTNVMVGAFGEVQVMDWGLAKELGRPPQAEPGSGETSPDPAASADPEVTTDHRPLGGSTDDRTRAGQSVGTPGYMPPEQARGDLELVDCRADVFALGGVLCAILTGRPPYAGGGRAEVMRKASAAELDEAMSGLDSCGADAELVALCKRCLSVDCAARPRDAGEVAEAVTAHLAAAEERARQAELDRVRVVEKRKRRRVQRTLAGAVIGLMFAAGFGVALASLWQRAERAKDTAERAQGEAETARAAEQELHEKFEGFEYGHTVQVAHQEWRDNNVPATLALLEGTKPKFRGWEWRYVLRLCHTDLLTLTGHTGAVTAASFRADGARVVTGSWDSTAMVWNAKSGLEVLALKGHTGPVTAASFRADGSRILTGSEDGTAKVWDARTGAELLTLKGHMSGVYYASFSEDGARVVTGSRDTTAKVWDATTGAELLTLKGHTSVVTSASF
ncbi:MAG TPA: serine/threonine-protein kinase, partial [Gemmataceae bacterium]|nr:serine/threonine-protein kinase [Gemmataceae bacterium]